MRELVERAQRGDLEAFGRLVGRFQDAVFGTAYSLLGDFHKAQDIAQESFIRAWRNLEGLREPGSFPGWLFRITRNCCLDFLRRRNPDPLPLSGVEMPASDVPPAPKELADAEMRGAVLDAIRSLSEPHRLATTLFYIDGYSVREVAEFLDVPAGTVKSRLHDARNKLRERMVAMVEDELKGSRPGPEFRDRLMRQIARVEVRPQQSPDDRGLVLLVDENDRCLPMLIGKAEELAIHRAVSGQESPRPLTHELLAAILESFDISVTEARVNELRSAAESALFIGELVLERDGEEWLIDSRPSDAIALAMMTGAKVTVAEDVMQKAGAGKVRSEEELDRVWARVRGPKQFNRALLELCARLEDLPQEQLARLAGEVGPEAIGTALAAKSQRMVGQKSTGERQTIQRVAIRFIPATEPEGRALLGDEAAAAVCRLLDKLKRVGIQVNTAYLPETMTPDAVVAARQAIRDAMDDAIR